MVFLDFINDSYTRYKNDDCPFEMCYIGQPVETGDTITDVINSDGIVELLLSDNTTKIWYKIVNDI